MKYASAMVGNSSSGILEAASFKLPVVNIGNRQRGRIHGNNVIDVDYGRSEILSAIKKAISLKFRTSLSTLTNPYGDGLATDRIVNKLKRVKLDKKLLLKHFYDMQGKI